MASSSPIRAAFIVAALFGTLAAAGCDKSDSKAASSQTNAATNGSDAGTAATEAKGPTIVKEEGPKPTPETVLASAGEHQVTLADFDQATKISLLFAPTNLTKMPPERLALPHVHLTMTRSLLTQKVIDAELERRGIEVSDADVKQWLTQHDKLSRFGKAFDDPTMLRELLEPYELTRDDLIQVARTELSNDLLTEALLEEVPRDEVWKAYEVERTTRTLALVSTQNVPSADEIDEWMGDNADEIDEYYRKNPNAFRIPKRVKLNVVQPEPGTKVSDDVLKKAAADLEKGIQPVTVARTHELVAKLDQRLIKQENSKAFAMKPGEVGWTSDGPRGAYAWKVTGFEPSRLPEMTRALRRQISAELLRTTRLTPDNRSLLEKAGEILEESAPKPGDKAAMDELEQEIEALGELEFEVTTFPKSPTGTIPNHGLAEEVLEAAFEADVGEVSDPILSRERGFLFRVLAQTTASRKEFKANYDANREAYVEALRPQIVRAWAQQKLNELGANVDVKPLRIKYGVIQK